MLSRSSAARGGGHTLAGDGCPRFAPVPPPPAPVPQADGAHDAPRQLALL